MPWPAIIAAPPAPASHLERAALASPVVPRLYAESCTGRRHSHTTAIPFLFYILFPRGVPHLLFSPRSPSLPLPPILPAPPQLYILEPCLTIIYAPNTSAVVDAIMNMTLNDNNPPIPRSRVKAFANSFDMDNYLIQNKQTVSAAVEFFPRFANDSSLEGVDFGLQMCVSASRTSRLLSHSHACLTCRLRPPLDICQSTSSGWPLLCPTSSLAGLHSRCLSTSALPARASPFPATHASDGTASLSAHPIPFLPHHRRGNCRNGTVKFVRGVFEDPNFFNLMPVQVAVERSIARYFYALRTGNSPRSLQWEISTSEFAHPAKDPFSFVGIIAPTFLLAAAMFTFVVQVSNVVLERETKLRESMRVMGLYDSMFWLSWLAWECIVVNFISSLTIVICGLIFQFDLFLKNDFGVLIFLFWFFELARAVSAHPSAAQLRSPVLPRASCCAAVPFSMHRFSSASPLGSTLRIFPLLSRSPSLPMPPLPLQAMTGLGYFLSTFVSKASGATFMGFIIFLFGFIIMLVVNVGQIPYSDVIDAPWLEYIFAMFPPALLAKGILDLGQATATDQRPGIAWSERDSYCKDSLYTVNCKWSLYEMYNWLLLDFGVYMVLCIYFDNINANEYGVRKPFYFFLMPSYWFGAKAKNENIEQARPRERTPKGASDAACGAGACGGAAFPLLICADELPMKACAAVISPFCSSDATAAASSPPPAPRRSRPPAPRPGLRCPRGWTRT